VSPYRDLVRLLALATIALGIALIVATLRHGGGVASTGILLGLLFVAAGAGRLYLLRRRG
jgi:hypothetical protein